MKVSRYNCSIKKISRILDKITIFSDSKNTVNQLNHEFAINNEQLRILAQESWSLIPKIPELKILWIPTRKIRKIWQERCLEVNLE